jgi:hypothetical protein
LGCLPTLTRRERRFLCAVSALGVVLRAAATVKLLPFLE